MKVTNIKYQVMLLGTSEMLNFKGRHSYQRRKISTLFDSIVFHILEKVLKKKCIFLLSTFLYTSCILHLQSFTDTLQAFF